MNRLVTDEELRARVEALGKLIESELPPPPVDVSVQDPEAKAWLEAKLASIEHRPGCLCGCGLPAPPPERPNRARRYRPHHYRRSHGMTNSPEWRAFHHAKNRCENPKNDDWKDYGGRGIKFLFVNFDQFMQFLGPRPGPEFSLDRRDVNGPYSPENCRWADPVTQANNRRPRRTAEEDFLESPF